MQHVRNYIKLFIIVRERQQRWADVMSVAVIDLQSTHPSIPTQYTDIHFNSYIENATTKATIAAAAEATNEYVVYA